MAKSSDSNQAQDSQNGDKDDNASKNETDNESADGGGNVCPACPQTINGPNVAIFGGLGAFALTVLAVVGYIKHRRQKYFSSKNFNFSSITKDGKADTKDVSIELMELLREVPLVGYVFGGATLAGVGAMVLRVTRRRHKRRWNRYWNGVKIGGLVTGWIGFMLIKSYTQLFSPASTDEEVEEVGTSKLLKYAAYVVASGMAVFTLKRMLFGSGTQRRHHRHKHR